MRNFSMAKGKKKSPGRGPYEVEDPERLGTGGIRIRQHRMSKGWTQEVLAAEAKVSVGTVSGLESGKAGASFKMLHKLAAALRTSVGALFDIDPRPGHGNDFWLMWNAANDSQRQRITDYAKGLLEPQK